MPFYLTPTTIAFILAALLLISFSMPAARALRHRLFLYKRFVLLEIPVSMVKNLKFGDLLKEIPPPFILEAAIHHLGKEARYYLAVPKSNIRLVVDKLGAREAEEYNIYHSGGYHLGFCVKDSGWSALNLNDIDFSRINEVGEGALVQVVVVKERGRKLANFRVLISAPTPYQAEEIALGLNCSLTGSKPTAVVKCFTEFIHKVTFREFDNDEAIAWSNT